MITIKNNAQDIVDTNYWETEHAKHGYSFLSWNAGAARLLVPESQETWIKEMQVAKTVIISFGKWKESGNRHALELLWEDEADSPFVITLVKEQCDRMLPEDDQGAGIVMSVWTRRGKQREWPAKYRKVDYLPCMQPWVEH